MTYMDAKAVREEADRLLRVAKLLGKKGYKYDPSNRIIVGLPLSQATQFTISRTCGCCSDAAWQATLFTVVDNANVYVPEPIVVGCAARVTGCVVIMSETTGLSHQLKRDIETYLAEHHPGVDEDDEDS